MAGLTVVIKKEVTDTLSNRGFLLSLLILTLSLIFWGYASGESYIKYVGWGLAWAATRNLGLIPAIAWSMNFLGALVAVAYGFNAINKEREEGSLKVMLSYPIYRDKIILGKLLASLLVISLATVVSLMISLAVFLAITRVMLTLDMVLRFSIFILFTVLFLCGWVGFSLFISQVFKDVKISLMITLIIIGVLNSNTFGYVINIFTHLMAGSSYMLNNGLVEMNVTWITLYNFISRFLPSDSYVILAGGLSSQTTVSFVGNEIVSVPSGLWDVLVNNSFSIGVLIVTAILTFVGSYVVFTRSDVT